LDGVIKKLAMANLLSGQLITMEMVLQTVPEYLRDAEPVSDTVDRIIDCVARHYEVSVDDIMGSSRKKDIKTARNVAMYVVRSMTGMSFPQIGAVFNRDHSTVHSNVNMIETELLSDLVLDTTINELMKEIKRGG
jgi:chromosomal replication initiator protein